jgi:hypothetical protein
LGGGGAKEEARRAAAQLANGLAAHVRTWRRHLEGSEFEILCITDHRPLQSFLTQSSLSGCLMMATLKKCFIGLLFLFLSDFNLDIAYVPGPTDAFAGGLSRRAKPPPRGGSGCCSIRRLAQKIVDNCKNGPEVLKLL